MPNNLQCHRRVRFERTFTVDCQPQKQNKNRFYLLARKIQPRLIICAELKIKQESKRQQRSLQKKKRQTQPHRKQQGKYQQTQQQKLQQLQQQQRKRQSLPSQHSQQEKQYDIQQRRRYLNFQLNKLTNADELLNALTTAKQIMDYINVATGAKTFAHILEHSSDQDQLNIRQNQLFGIFFILVELMIMHVNSMEPQAVSNCMWSLAKASQFLGISAEDEELVNVFNLLCARSWLLLHKLKPVDFANILWAMAKLQFINGFQWSDFLIASTQFDVEDYKPQDVSNFLLVMALRQQYNTEINLNAVLHFVECSKRYLHEMKSQEIANLIWSLKVLRFYDQDVIDAIEEIIIDNKLQFKNQEISIIAYSLANFGVTRKDEVVQELVNQIKLNSFRNSQQYGNIIYGLSLLNCRLEIVQDFVNFMIQEDFKFRKLEFRKEGLCQIRRASIFYGSMGQKLTLPKNICYVCKEKQRLEIMERKSKNYQFLEQVFTFIQLRYPHAQKRVSIQGGEMVVSIKIIKGLRRVAVEPRTQASYFSNFPLQLTQISQAHLDILELLGWNVVVVQQLRWNEKGYRELILREIEEGLQ
eukprot:TRINITY_DN1746_c0_g1_i5.p1 TRINITY_DN1746_c0_g1~~TRINITY_DN1746_c0_g1_i5.p1  ORF type:complete len:585 (-),score=48.84 TRINITY_DN1746_c0_g1_i5:61-1815(-)